MSKENVTYSKDIIYLKTNFLLQPKNASWIGTVICPANGPYLENKHNKAIVPCFIHIEQSERLFLSNAFRAALTGDNTRRHQELLTAYRGGLGRFQIGEKNDFIRKFISEQEIREIGETAEEMVWQKGFYTVNMVDTPQDSIAIFGDFDSLSRTFMTALVNGGGYVNVEFDPIKMASDITYEPPHKLTRAGMQKKLQLTRPTKPQG